MFDPKRKSALDSEMLAIRNYYNGFAITVLGLPHFRSGFMPMFLE